MEDEYINFDSSTETMDKWKNIRNLKLSNPNDYDNNNYIFLVHAIDLPNSIYHNFHLMSVLNNYGGEYNPSQNIDLALTPERIAEKNLISCSLVAKKGEFEALETYKPFGLILKCPIENIIYAGHQDLGTPYTQFDSVMEKYSNTIIPPIDSLLNPSAYNEILINGTTAYGKVEIVGVFINPRLVEMEEENIAELVIKEAKKLEQKLNVPLILFPKKKHIIEDKPIEIIYDSWPGEPLALKEISFNKNGKKYRLFVQHSGIPLLQVTSNTLMKLMDENDYTIFMSEIYKLPENELLKISSLIEQLPSIFENQQLSNENDSYNKRFH